MSVSDPVKPYPVVHHFYPINPETSLQQQTAVYNSPDNPLVAPILPASSHPFRDAQPKSNKKRNIKDLDDSEFKYIGKRKTGSNFQRTTRSSYPQDEPSKESPESPTIRLGPRHLRRVPYVELPNHNSIDLTLYHPISLSSPASQVLLGPGGHYTRARSPSQTSFGEPALSSPSPHPSPHPSPASEHLEQGGPIQIESKQKVSRGKKAKSDTNVKNLVALDDDEATTCHQCRRKTTKEKMHCRKLRPDGNVCPYLFCHTCVDVRYGEVFDPFHPSWHCPRCRGMCNCSICLRKAGLGFVLDEPMTAQFTGAQGGVSVLKQGKKRSRGGIVKKGDQKDEGQSRVSIREWLARKGLALGTEEWITERRRQGVRYVVGKSPPPPDFPSPYMEARFNPTIAACTEYFEDDDNDNTSNEKPLPEDGNNDNPSNEKSLPEGDGDILTSSGPLTLDHNDETTISRSAMDSNREPIPTNVQPNPGTINGLTSPITREDPGSHTSPLPDAGSSALPTLGEEDLPGLSRASTRGLRLIVGKRLPNKKKHLKPPKFKKPKATKSKRKADVDLLDSDYEPTGRKTRVRIRMGGYNTPDADLETHGENDDQNEEDVATGSSPPSDAYQSAVCDEMFTPPPAEPVLVPTEYYAPSKLDATMPNDSQTHFGHTYWSFNAVASEQRHEPRSRVGPGSSPTLLMSTPLYSNNDQHPYPQFSTGEAYAAGPSTAQSTALMTRDGAQQQHSPGSTSFSNPHTSDDYLNSHIYHHHPRDADVYTPHSLAAFTTLDETWAPVNMESYSNVEIDMSPLHVEGIAR